MSLPALAQLSDVEALMGRAATAQEQTYITTLLASASATARAYMRQDITQVLADVIVLNGTWGTRLTLPQRPVTNVSSVSVRGSALSSGSWSWDRFGHIDLVSGSQVWADYDNIFGPPSSIANGATHNLGGGPALSGGAGTLYPNVQSGPSWGGSSAAIAVTYDHGYALVPGDIANQVAGMVAGSIVTPTGIVSEQIGGYKVAYARQSGAAMSLTSDAKSVFDRYRIRNSTSDGSLPR